MDCEALLSMFSLYFQEQFYLYVYFSLVDPVVWAEVVNWGYINSHILASAL